MILGEETLYAIVCTNPTVNSETILAAFLTVSLKNIH